jgi:hypothetical protein
LLAALTIYRGILVPRSVSMSRRHSTSQLDPNVASQGLGSYLVTISNCNDCHTQPNFVPGGDPTQHQPKQANLVNSLAGGRLFPTPTGNFCSRMPLLIAQGANDPRVKQTESDQMVAALRACGFPVTYVLFPDEGHGFARPENAIACNALIEDFLARHLGGEADGGEHGNDHRERFGRPTNAANAPLA